MFRLQSNVQSDPTTSFGMGAARRHVIVLVASSLAIAALAATYAQTPQLVWNATASAPVGLYEVMPQSAFARGELVLIRPPQWVRNFAATRGYLPVTVPMVKRIAAQNGDTVCRQEDAITINGRVLAHALLADREGRLLPTWSGCRKLGDGDVFILMHDVRASFDSRYFGPIPSNGIIGKLVPLWTR